MLDHFLIKFLFIYSRGQSNRAEKKWSTSSGVDKLSREKSQIIKESKKRRYHGINETYIPTIHSTAKKNRTLDNF